MRRRFGVKGETMRTSRYLIPALTVAALVTGTGVATAGTTAPAGHGGALPADVTAIMGKAQYANGSWGLLETHAQGNPILSQRANEMFIPGSSAKLFSVSAVWSMLGPDHRFTTPVYVTGHRAGSTVDGNLVLVGSGDLSLGGRTTPAGGIAWTNFDHADANAIPGATLTPENPLAGILNLAAQVRAAGITRVRGNVLVDDRLFTADFDPQPTPVMINDNLIDLVATPTTPGRPASFSYRPAAASLTVDAHVRTVAAGRPSKLIFTGSAPGRIVVTGSVAAGSQPLINVAPITDPASFARTVFVEALRKAGVQVDAKATGTNPASQLPVSRSYPGSSRVAAYVSPPYRDYAKLILKVSHNLGANLGVCLLAVRAGSPDCSAGIPVIRAFLQRAGVTVSQVVLNDGRGGDPADRATPLAVTQILRYWLGRADFAGFRACLPILGVDGSLTNVATGSPARGKITAKTGTLVAGDDLNQRLAVQTKALAGYFQAGDGSWRIFDVVVNNAGGGPDVTPVLDANEDVGEIAAALWRHAQ
jgi:D-alanyl-D-alanine carboxypeptidase/D-alanyl-D-alanine-endopeptidase (penicillin-binding protein 4)